MPKTNLEKSISEAANAFALEIIEAVKNSTLQELIVLQGADEASRNFRKPPKAASGAKAVATRKRRNYPKCAFPGCEKNIFTRGKGFCGEHFKQHMDGKIKAAAEYK